MSKTYLVVPDQHAHPDHNNDRADYLGKFIKDLKPHVVVNIGDAADLASLSTFDKGKHSFHARNYEKDIDAHLDFQERMWAPIRKSKRKQPYRIILEGNHEHRIKRALEASGEMAGDRFGLSFRNLDFDSYYHEVIEYNGSTPGIRTMDGIDFAHFFISGVMGRPIGGIHHAASLVTKNFTSSVCGHSHTADFSVRTTQTGKKLFGLVSGVYQDYNSDWAGHINDLWWRGLVVLRDVDDGYFDPEFIGLKALEKEYG
jgi:hypothetical protein